ncbi:MAG: Smr/MutS family protein [Clostridia bacterium]
MGKNGFLTVDLHGCNQYQAKIRLDSAFRRAGGDVYRIRVIHGHNGGTVLRELTRTYENHPKVKRMIAAAGETVFILREI